MTMFPTALFAFARKSQLAEVAACMKLYDGKPQWPRTPEGYFTTKPPDAVAALRDKYMRDEGDPPFPVYTSAWPELAFDLLPGFNQLQFANIMESQIISCWAAFENLAADLWETCVNVRSKLGYDALVVATNLGDDTDQEVKKKAKLPLTLRQLERFDFNLKNRLGTILKDKFNFTRREATLDAYRKVFGKAHESQIKAIFNEPGLRELNAVRNVLVHREGVADVEFKDKTQESSQFASIKEGEKLLIDGEICAALVTSGYESGLKLIDFVDEWLSKNP